MITEVDVSFSTLVLLIFYHNGDIIKC